MGFICLTAYLEQTIVRFGEGHGVRPWLCWKRRGSGSEHCSCRNIANIDRLQVHTHDKMSFLFMYTYTAGWAFVHVYLLANEYGCILYFSRLAHDVQSSLYHGHKIRVQY